MTSQSEPTRQATAEECEQRTLREAASRTKPTEEEVLARPLTPEQKALGRGTAVYRDARGRLVADFRPVGRALARQHVPPTWTGSTRHSGPRARGAGCPARRVVRSGDSGDDPPEPEPPLAGPGALA